jgi:hypothetical protein
MVEQNCSTIMADKEREREKKRGEEERGARGESRRGWEQNIPFTGTFPLAYFLQPSPSSTVSTSSQ